MFGPTVVPEMHDIMSSLGYRLNSKRMKFHPNGSDNGSCEVHFSNDYNTPPLISCLSFVFRKTNEPVGSSQGGELRKLESSSHIARRSLSQVNENYCSKSNLNDC